MLRYDDLRLIQIDSREGSDSVVSRITRLPQHSALLIGTWRVGDDGQYLMYSAMNDLIAENPTVPVFTLSGAGLESVAIGGYNPKYKAAQARSPGRLPVITTVSRVRYISNSPTGSTVSMPINSKSSISPSTNFRPGVSWWIIPRPSCASTVR